MRTPLNLKVRKNRQDNCEHAERITSAHYGLERRACLACGDVRIGVVPAAQHQDLIVEIPIEDPAERD